MGLRAGNGSQAPAPNRLWKSIKRAFRLFPHTAVFHQEHSSQAKAVFKLAYRKEPKLTTRRNLTPTELTFATICFERIDPNRLKPGARKLFQSLSSQFTWDSKLSDAQLTTLKRLKLGHDLHKRSDAIAKGRISFDDDARTDAKLNTIYNKIRRPD
jgi:hypothetical protein